MKGSAVSKVWLGRRGLAGAIDESAEGLGIAHGDVGQNLAVQLHTGQPAARG